ncbi:MAG TPA: hypothetical protein VHW00_05995 [Thermoanaerobaculia bacterium]|nr:hypothetical protein [Thermoanaerobaculia bacterium]
MQRTERGEITAVSIDSIQDEPAFVEEAIRLLVFTERIVKQTDESAGSPQYKARFLFAQRFEQWRKERDRVPHNLGRHRRQGRHLDPDEPLPFHWRCQPDERPRDQLAVRAIKNQRVIDDLRGDRANRYVEL